VRALYALACAYTLRGDWAAAEAVLDILEFIPIKPLVAMASNAHESYATHSRLP
jgi:hypothetical protein